jgi:hypothetical protein
VLGRLPRPDTRTAKEKRGTNERKRCWMLPWKT